MTTTTPPNATIASGTPSVTVRVAAILAAILAVLDVLGALPYMGNIMPMEIGIAVLAIAALTIVGALFAFLGRPWGIWVAAVSRFLSIGAMIPVFTEPGAPAEAIVPTAIQIAATIIVIVLLLVGLRKRA